ncbi:alkaline D-peptidase [Streptomyces sp. CB02923]|uniref:serine hydrolase domain-containing protein n=1 Tax=Streptomyces sp. CB02923 TaxID=1718985 RepID=UPI0009394CB6|nr:serine hydrolase domain-containing protein [Streptomyces sp. CB02923]OKI06168.1 alkaline D-peptidase [Streptomyces sp. CB02923]
MTNSASSNREQIQQALDWAVAEVAVPGIVAEVRDADGTWFGSAGAADLVSGLPRQEGEHVHVGSAGKAFTAATVLQLEAEGRLSIEDTVERWLPGALNVNGYDGNKITIRHLLSNTSGLFVTGLAPELSSRYATRSTFAEHRFDTWTLDELLELTVSQPPIHEPGTAFAYSNGGFYLAGMIIEKVTGNTYAEEVARTIVQPLGLTHTYVRPADETGYPEPHPKGYSSLFLKDGADPAAVTADNWESMFEEPGLPPLDVTEYNSSWAYAAGNVISTTGEMLRVFNAFASGSLLPPAQHREMWTMLSTEGGNWMPHATYGLGVFELDRAVTGGVHLRGIGGSMQGSHLAAVGTPDGEQTIVVHTNTEFKTWKVLFKALEAEFGIPPVQGL